MPLAHDLNDLIHRFGGAMARAAEAVLKPRHRPGDPLPDLAPLESCRTTNSGKPFRFFDSQRTVIAGALAGLREKGRAWLVCEMGCGKSPMSLAAAYTLLKHKPHRLLVLCPGHIVRKWKREVEWMLPGVHCHVIRNFADLEKFEAKARSLDAPLVAVVGKDAAKLGFEVDRPCAARRRMHLTSSDTPRRAATIEVASCPRCGAILQTEEEGGLQPVLYADYIAGDEPKTCAACGDRLVTSARGFRKNPHIDRYIQRKMKGVFDLLIADEVHELAGAETIQGNCFGTLASACRYTLALTGTLIGGKASDLHAPLWRMSPALLDCRGFSLKGFKGSRISAIARNERGFIHRYGVMEHQIVRASRGERDDFAGNIQRGACGRKKSYKTNERPRPGISPDLFNHFLLDRAVFMSLADLGPALPTMERVLIGCPMGAELKRAYEKLDGEIKAAIKVRANGKGPPGLAATRVQVLDAYLDKPWGWEPILAPTYNENGEKIGTEEVAWPVDLGTLHADGKDRKLIEVVRSEVKSGRRCAIYPQFTGVHDVREKIVKLLTDAGIRAHCMPDTVKPEAREDWIASNAGGIDALIVHPKRVMTGLDLVEFPTLIWFQVGYSTHVLRQASARARRPIQTKPCKVFFLFYKGTIQEAALALMGEKEAASQALEGVFDTNALKAMMNGGENDDILAALASNLGDTKSAQAAWGELTPIPFHTPTKTVLVSTRSRRQQQKESQKVLVQGVLFDLNLFDTLSSTVRHKRCPMTAVRHT